MLRNFDEDSGRSSCSAASFCLSPVMDHHNNVELAHGKRKPIMQEASTNTDLKISMRPRSCTGLLKSPGERDPFPSCREPKSSRNTVFKLFDTPRMGGLSDAHSTSNIACSTQLEFPIPKTNAKSMTSLVNDVKINSNKLGPPNTNFRRGKPVQRAASRLYKAEAGSRGKEGCIGPEFIVRASQPVKHIDLTMSAISDKRVITVVLLNGLKVEVLCDPNTITTGQLFKALVVNEKYDQTFMLGIATLSGGDFVFLPDEYKIKKIAPVCWFKGNNKRTKTSEGTVTLTLFLRIKFFLPKNIASNIQGGEWRYRVYLQLRRATVEGQMTSTIQNLILLAGYALHIEFGDFTYREHGSADYFLLEHYLPESAITSDMADIKLKMKRAHESRNGLDKNKAIMNYITLAQTFRDYGAHFYSAVWATRDGFCRDVWLSISPRGITLYSRTTHIPEESSIINNNNRIVLQSLPWHHIHTFYYNKKSLYIIPNSYSGLAKIGVKYKLKMIENKSYFTFWLASLHHRLYLKLYAKEDFIKYLSDEINLDKEDSPKMSECSNYQDSYNLAVRNPIRPRRPVRRRFKVDMFVDKKVQNKENETPSTEELIRQILLQDHKEENNFTSSTTNANSSTDGLSSSENLSLPRRHGVKMGTRVFKNATESKQTRVGMNESSSDCRKPDAYLTTAHSDSDDLRCSVNKMELLPERHYHQDMCHSSTAYVLESPKVYSDVFNYNALANESCVSSTLFEKIENLECVQGERVFVTAQLKRDEMNTLGLQVAEGSDGNVYIKSITPGCPAALCQKLLPGDQIISVNGQTLLNVKYDKALAMLQAAPKQIELIVLQSVPSGNNNSEFQCKYVMANKMSNTAKSQSDLEITDDELLNEEALKTIYALIKLTKEKVIRRMKDKNIRQTTPSGSKLKKCFSENKIDNDSDFGNYSSQESTPQKKDDVKFSTWRGHIVHRPKRRPLSLSIPNSIDLPHNFLDGPFCSELQGKSSLKSIQTSLSSLNKCDKSTSNSAKNIALPRNFGFSRRWVGPVRYPVTPCKNSEPNSDTNGAIEDINVLRRHFVYGAGDSDEDQIFL